VCGPCCLARFWICSFFISVRYISLNVSHIFLRSFTRKKAFLDPDCYRLPRHKFVIFWRNNVCICQFLTDCKHLRTRFVSFHKLVYNATRKTINTNQYNVKFKMLYLINRNACVFRYFSTGQSFRSLAFLFRMDHGIVGKSVGLIRDILWSKLSSKLLAVPNHNKFSCIAVKFQEKWNFPNVICLHRWKAHSH